MSYKTKLLVLLGIEVVLIALYRAVGLEFLFYPSLVFGALCIIYALSIKCPSCGRRQVIRSMSIFDTRLPESSCYMCKANLSAANNE